MEVFALIAVAILSWLVWQLVKAKRFNRFKDKIEIELKPLVIEKIKEHLVLTRCELLPNNNVHQQATIDYWCQYKSRILQVALQLHVIDKQWLIDSKNIRNCQHLFHIEKHRMPSQCFSTEIIGKENSTIETN